MATTEGDNTNRPVTWNGNVVKVTIDGKSQYVFKTDTGYKTQDGTEVKIDSTGKATPIIPMKVGGNFAKPDGSAITTTTGQSIKVQSIAQDGTAYGVVDGNLYKLSKGADTAIQMTPNTIKGADIAALAGSPETLKAVAALDAEGKIFTNYMEQAVGAYGTPDATILKAFVDNGSTSAISYIIEKLKTGNYKDYYSNPKIATALSNISKTPPASVSGARYLIDQASMSATFNPGNVISIDGTYYYSKTAGARKEGTGTAFGGHQVYEYPFTFVNMATGEETIRTIYST